MGYKNRISELGTDEITQISYFKRHILRDNQTLSNKTTDDGMSAHHLSVMFLNISNVWNLKLRGIIT